jgi:pyruvate ferredoxin oxidoreductase alpha subunit
MSYILGTNQTFPVNFPGVLKKDEKPTREMYRQILNPSVKSSQRAEITEECCTSQRIFPRQPLRKLSKEVISEANEEFAKKFKRKYGDGLIEEYRNDKDTVIVALGSVCGTIKEVVDNL